MEHRLYQIGRQRRLPPHHTADGVYQIVQRRIFMQQAPNAGADGSRRSLYVGETRQDKNLDRAVLCENFCRGLNAVLDRHLQIH